MIGRRLLCASALALCLIGGTLALRSWKHAPHTPQQNALEPEPVHAKAAALPASGVADRADSLDRDPAAPVASFESLPDRDLQRNLTRQLLESVAKTNPAVAAQMALDMSESFQAPLLAAVLSVWGKDDPKGAVEWMKALPEGSAKKAALLSLASVWAEADPVAAADYAFRMSQPQPQLLRLAAAHWAEQDPASAMNWGEQIQPGEARDHFVSGLSDTLVEKSPADAARLVASMEPGPTQADTAVMVMIDWMRSDPGSASAWLVNFPSGAVREKALQESLVLLAEQNPAAAQTLLEALAPGSERDQAARRFLSLVQNSNPAAGAKALTVIENSALLQEETERLAQHWLMVDPSAARAWLAAVALPEETKANLLAAP